MSILDEVLHPPPYRGLYYRKAPDRRRFELSQGPNHDDEVEQRSSSHKLSAVDFVSLVTCNDMVPVRFRTRY